ncbi:MAG: sigma-70 family RNA polymerase sigma factor [Limisphaerales bacterium]
MTDSRQLLRDYAERLDEQAFGELVRCHVSLVYSTALRLVNGDAPLAQEITQTVFTDLARQAKALPADAVVGGWLHRHTCFTASKARRTEHRRHIREQEAVTMQALNDENDAAWKQIAPVLDEAMNRLGDRDRNAIVLRFFEQQSLRAVGEALGASEDAARMRVDRALDKLRKNLARRGVALSGAALTTVLAGEAVTAAPAGLAANVAGMALAGAATAATSPAFLKIATMTRVKLGIAGTALVVALVTPLVLQRQSLVELRHTNATLQDRIRALDNTGAINARLAKPEVDADELERLRREHHELLRLRGEVGLLRQQMARTSELRATGVSADAKTNLPPAQVVVEAKFAECPKAKLKELSLSWIGTGSAVLTESQLRTVLDALKQTEGVDLLGAPRVTTLSGRQAQVSDQQAVEVGGTKVMIGPGLDVVPLVQADGDSIQITAVAHLTELTATADPGSPESQQARETEASGQAVIRDGQTLLLQEPISHTVVGTGEPADKILLVFITATLIDPAGNRIHPAEQTSDSLKGSLPAQ